MTEQTNTKCKQSTLHRCTLEMRKITETRPRKMHKIVTELRIKSRSSRNDFNGCKLTWKLFCLVALDVLIYSRRVIRAMNAVDCGRSIDGFFVGFACPSHVFFGRAPVRWMDRWMAGIDTEAATNLFGYCHRERMGKFEHHVQFLGIVLMACVIRSDINDYFCFFFRYFSSHFVFCSPLVVFFYLRCENTSNLFNRIGADTPIFVQRTAV